MMRASTTPDLRATLDQVRGEIVGRETELELVLVAVASGRDLLLEGPPGTSKTTLLRAITRAWDIPLVFVEGNAELTPGRLLGYHDPARVLAEGFSPDTFVPGPLVQAMQRGGFLHFEEFNRAPEDTLNALLTAIADREVTLPRVGTIRAEPSFRVIGSMNPFDNVGTTRLSTSIKDRLARLTIGYQDAEAERDVVALRSDADRSDELAEALITDAVGVTRMTRAHPDVRQGSSVRGAIDLYLMADELFRLRGVESRADDRYAAAFLEVMNVALSGRVLMDEAAGSHPEAVLLDIWQRWFVLDPAAAQPG